MAELTARQKQAEVLAKELQRLLAVVTSPMPLERDANLRFQVLDAQRDAVLQKIGEWGWTVGLLNTSPRFTTKGLEPASLYELRIEGERQEVPQERIIKGEIAEREKKSDIEVQRVRKYLGLS